MLEQIITMYLTLFPAIFAGIFNMVWCKSPYLQRWYQPIDRGKTLADGKRLFGDNKTWKGFFGMTVLGMLFSVIWGALSSVVPYMQAHNYFYVYHQNTFGFNVWIGLLLGLMYVLCELPNSFMKRRIDIAPGKEKQGAGKQFFVFLDQADSVIGMVFVVSWFYPLSFLTSVFYVMLGAGTHIVINIFLYKLKLRKNRY